MITHGTPAATDAGPNLLKISESAFCGGVAGGAMRSPGHRFRTRRGHGKTAEPAVSRRRVLFACPNTLDRRLACCVVGGAIFGNQFQSRSFVGTSSDA